MKTLIQTTQQWAMTGNTSCYSVRNGFTMDDVQSIDAPKAVPAGCTRENVITNIKGMEDTRAIIGGLVWVR